MFYHLKLKNRYTAFILPYFNYAKTKTFPENSKEIHVLINCKGTRMAKDGDE